MRKEKTLRILFLNASIYNILQLVPPTLVAVDFPCIWAIDRASIARDRAIARSREIIGRFRVHLFGARVFYVRPIKSHAVTLKRQSGAARYTAFRKRESSKDDPLGWARWWFTMGRLFLSALNEISSSSSPTSGTKLSCRLAIKKRLLRVAQDRGERSFLLRRSDTS